MNRLTKRETPDRSKIDLRKPGQSKHWAHALGISEEKLCRVIEKVGNSAAAVRKELENDGDHDGVSHRRSDTDPRPSALGAGRQTRRSRARILAPGGTRIERNGGPEGDRQRTSADHIARVE
jgi:hypothetical protein